MTSLVSPQQRTVSRHAYWDPEIFRREQELVFKKSWLFVAHESEIAHNGDYLTRRMGADPVIVSRDEHGRLRVFLNTCPHRGTALCRTDMGNSSHFRCSYHGWTFTNSGDLRGVPEMREVYPSSFDKSAIRLFEAPHVDVHAGLVFACWDPEAPTLQTFLGDFAWYLHALFGKTDFEVVGAPMRGIVRTNWKIGAENYMGDGYHLTTTHKSAIDMGVFEPGRKMPQLGTYIERKHPSYCVDAGNGHGIRIQRMPLEFETPTFLGYPEQMWSAFADALDPGQIEMQQALAVAHGNAFPNCSILEAFAPHVGADTSPSMYLHIRQWHPLAADSTELWMWCLVPRAASEEWKLGSQRAFTRHLGFGGVFETDDFQNWTSMATNNQTPTAWQHSFNYEGRPVSPAADVDWPGDVYPVDHAEVNQQAMYRRWQELMAQ